MNMKEIEPVCFHLREAQEHLNRMIVEINNDEVDPEGFAMDMAHLYHHINSAWNSRTIRSLDDPVLHEKFLELAQHPTDLQAWEVYDPDE